MTQSTTVIKHIGGMDEDCYDVYCDGKPVLKGVGLDAVLAYTASEPETGDEVADS